MTVPEVAHSEHQTQLAIALGDDRILAEHEGLGSLLGLGHLDEHAAYKESIHNGAQQRLEQEEDDALRTLLSDVPEAIADGSLCLYEEEEGRGEVVDIDHTRGVAVIMSPV